MLKISNLTKRFGGLIAVNDVSFEIKGGEIVGLIGPNGSGKSTTVNLITNVYKPDSGSVKLQGTEITNLSTNDIVKVGIARTFQIPKPFFELNVLENIMIASLLHEKDINAAKENALGVIKMVGLNNHVNTMGNKLSIQLRKRLELAKALATKPKVVLLDEVMAGLTAVEMEEDINLIKKLSSEGLTFMVIEHVMKAVMSLSNRIVVLEQGKIIAEGKPSEISTNEKVIEAYLGRSGVDAIRQ